VSLEGFLRKAAAEGAYTETPKSILIVRKFTLIVVIVLIKLLYTLLINQLLIPKENLYQ
jgi:hypothetical protein